MILSLFILLPSFVHTFIGLSSMTYGFLLGIIFLIFYFIILKRKKPILNQNKIIILSSICLILFFNCLSVIMSNQSSKSSYLLIISCFYLIFIVLYSEDLLIKFINDFNRYGKKILFSVVIIVTLSFFFKKLNLGGNNSIFVYSEPSHLILAILPLLIFVALQSSTRSKLFLVLLMIAFLFMKKSFLALLATAILCLFIKSYFFFLFSACTLSFLIFKYYSYFEYYFDRLTIFALTNNLSLLSFQDGYYRLFEVLSSKYCLGLGIGNLGYTQLDSSPYRKRINEIYEGNLNLYDGSIFSAKLITEFGFIGLILLLIALLILFNLFYLSSFKKLSRTLLFTFCIPFLFEAFIRGSSYFTFNIMLFLIISINYLSSKKALIKHSNALFFVK